MRSNNEPIDNVNKPELLEETDSSPVRSFTTAWILSNGRLFWVDIAVVGPISEESEDYRALCRGKAKHHFKAISDIVEFLKEELR